MVMTYRINKTDGSLLSEITNGTIDQISTDLTLIGLDVSGYGEFINENFVKLLENFSNSSLPSNPIMGQIWYDSSESILKVYDGNGFKTIGSPIIKGSRPLTSTIGDLWIDSTELQMYFHDGNSFRLLGPSYTKTQKLSGMTVNTVVSNTNESKVVVLIHDAEKLVGIINSGADFTTSAGISGYTGIVHKGLTLVNDSKLSVGSFYIDDSDNDYSKIQTSKELWIDCTAKLVNFSNSKLSGVSVRTDPLVNDVPNVDWVRNRVLPLTMDTTGLTTAQIISYLNQIAPITEYKLCNILCNDNGTREVRTFYSTSTSWAEQI
jgi:hypothetical protein